MREKDAAQPKATSLHGNVAGAGAARGGLNAAVDEQRVLWFVYKSPEHRADSTAIAAALGLDAVAIRDLIKSMIRKSMLRELPKTAERPNAQFAVAPRLIQHAAQLAGGPDPAEL